MKIKLSIVENYHFERY